jgi:hypothetical protein
MGMLLSLMVAGCRLWKFVTDEDVYTVAGAVFEKTYRRVSPGIYIKTAPVWAEVATEPGSVVTKEGESHYQAGDYLVYNKSPRPFLLGKAR